MEAKFHSHSIYAGQDYYVVSAPTGTVCLVLLKEDINGNYAFEFLGGDFRSPERKDIMSAVIAAMP